MAFLKKKIANASYSSHSRSVPVASTKAPAAFPATVKSSGKAPTLPPKLPISSSPVIQGGSDSIQQNDNTAVSQEDIIVDQNDSGFSFEEGVSLQYAGNGGDSSEKNDSPSTLRASKKSLVLEDEQIPATLSSRKSSGGSVASLSKDKLIYSWDVTDPEEWTMIRVIAWFRFNEFSDAWINYFKRHQIYGDKFLKLMALDNFVKYQKFLPQTHNSSYNRFQYLLKRTLETNVGNGHIRNKSDKSSGSRSSSDSLKLKKKRSQDGDHSRSTSESVLTDNRKIGSDILDDKSVPLRSHQKANSASSLYRRSFISLRGSSVSNASKNEKTNININIPQRPLSTIESATQICPTNSRSSSSPLSPNYAGIFRRQHKSSSSESSIFNTLFGSGNSSNQNNGLTDTNPASGSYRSASLESLPKTKREGSSSSPLKQSPVGAEEKPKIWEKLKKKEAVLDSVSSLPSRSTTETEVKAEASPIPNVEGNAQEEKPSAFSWKEFVLEKKFYPLKTSGADDRFILITKDNRSFIPLNINMINGIEELKDSMALTLGITHKNFTIHLTDFGCDIGCVIPDDLLETMRENMFYNLPGKFYVKDQMKIQLRPRTGTISNDVSNSLRSVKSKGSVKSAASSVINSNDDTSVVTSCSDANSFDDTANLAGRLVYPQTPSYYYDTENTSTNTDVDYWNFKDTPLEESQPLKLPKIRSRSNSKLKRVPESTPYPNSVSTSGSTFKVIRKGSENEIDFDKRRESPYVSSDFAPRREAPKPPTGSQISLENTPSLQNLPHTNSPPKLQRRRTGTFSKRKARPPPPVSIIPKGTSRSSSFGSGKQVKHSSASPVESIVNSYTPGSTQVLVPQPYKGATDPGKISKTDDGIGNPISVYIQNQRANRSNSVHSVAQGIHPSPPRLLKRASSKRVFSSASAADIFDENDISFADAPALSDSDNDDVNSSSSSEIVWSKKTQKDDESDSSDDIIWTPEARKTHEKPLEIPSIELQDESSAQESGKETYHDVMEDSTDFDTISATSSQNKLGRKMTLRPSPEVVFQNLEKFFPGTDLDKPIVEGVTPPSSPKCAERDSPDVRSSVKDRNDSEVVSPITSRTGTPQTMISKPSNNSQEVLTPVSRTLKPPKRTKTIRIIAREASEARRDSQSRRLKRKNTKMWGTRVVEVTDKRMVAINKAKNSNGEYKEFAWIKGDMIGKGSFGSVFLGLNVTTGEMMAVKQVEVPKYGSQDETTLSVLEALRSEVSTLKDLDHLNIVQYLGFENKNSIYSLFLEYVAGGSVGSLIRLYGRFDENLIRFLTVQVLQGLSYLHSRGILHRDMKADNLLLDLDGVCKISDFGISKKSNNIYSNSDMTMRGTVFWMAPEMVDTKQGYSAKVDIWSLGCVVLEMFAGKRPWSNFEVVAAMFKIGKSKSAPPIPEDTLPLISQHGREFLDACFEIDPEKRPTADTLLSHPFCEVDGIFDFSKTKLAKFIKSNDKINSSKLRVSSQDSSN